jgi:flagellar hook-associated protein 2
VSQLAQAQTLTTKSTQADTKTAIATADSKITFTAGNGKDPVTVDISAANSSLNGHSRCHQQSGCRRHRQYYQRR